MFAHGLCCRPCLCCSHSAVPRVNTHLLTGAKNCTNTEPLDATALSDSSSSISNTCGMRSGVNVFTRQPLTAVTGNQRRQAWRQSEQSEHERTLTCARTNARRQPTRIHAARALIRTHLCSRTHCNETGDSKGQQCKPHSSSRNQGSTKAWLLPPAGLRRVGV
jgi:hypothetical protein